MLAYLANTAECLNATAKARARNGTGGAGGDVSVTYLWITCILGYLNTVTNGFSLVVFILDKKNIIMRRLLLLLSLSETVLNICLAVSFTVLLRVGAKSLASESLTALHLVTATHFLSFMLFNAYIMIRNWCLVMIAGSRCEVVLNPLSTRSGQIFSPQRTLLGYVGLSVLSLLIYMPRLFEFTWTVFQFPCDEGSNSSNRNYLLTVQTHHKLDAIPEYGHYKTLLLFPMQTVVPIFLISGLSFLIIFTLRRRELPEQMGSSFNAASHRSQDAATKTVMVLLICFVVFELPTFLFFVLNRTVFKSLRNFRSVRQHTTFVANILVCLDSFSNFIVYSSTSNTFRETVRRILRLPNAKSAPNHSGIHSGNYTMIRSVNANLNLSWSANSGQTVRRPGSCGLNASPSPRTPSTPAQTPSRRNEGKSSAVDGDEDYGFV